MVLLLCAFLSALQALQQRLCCATMAHQSMLDCIVCIVVRMGSMQRKLSCVTPHGMLAHPVQPAVCSINCIMHVMMTCSTLSAVHVCCCHRAYELLLFVQALLWLLHAAAASCLYSNHADIVTRLPS